MKRTWEVIFGMDAHMDDMSIHVKITPFFSIGQDQQMTIIFNIYIHMLNVKCNGHDFWFGHS